MGATGGTVGGPSGQDGGGGCGGEGEELSAPNRKSQIAQLPFSVRKGFTLSAL